jgi:hypothetical protein
MLGQSAGVVSAAVERDPFLQSLTTSRTARRARHDDLFRSKYFEERPFARTKGTIPEYHSFSQFSELLRRNKGAVLDR